MKTLQLILCLFVYHSLSYAQNYVPNHSFEVFENNCPIDFGDFAAIADWNGIFSVNYYNECNQTMPLNIAGYQSAQDGEGYAGIYCYSQNGYNHREYVSVRLSEPLKAGKEYIVSFYVSLSDSSWLATRNIGAFFSQEAPPDNINSLLSIKPQIESSKDSMIDNKLGWTKVEETFIPDKQLNFITIGNFYNDQLIEMDTSAIPGGISPETNPGYFNISYYYVDNVFVGPLDTITHVATNPIDKIRIYPNPTEGKVYIDFAGLNDKDAYFEIFDMAGRKISSCPIEIWEGKAMVRLPDVISGLYPYHIVTHDGLVLKADRIFIGK